MTTDAVTRPSVYGAILAGGSGTRMGNPEKPKQFLMLGDKPVLVHTVEKFVMSGLFDEVVVLCPPDWMNQTKDLLERYGRNCGDVAIAAGGARRNHTIANAIAFIKENYDVDDDAIIVTHDAVRPFATHRILQDNVEAARAHGACDTVIPATDTIVESVDGETINAIPDRSMLYQGQTPQSFRVLQLEQVLSSLTEEEDALLTDACKAYILRNLPVALVKGDTANIKITYPEDMRIAASLLGRADV